MRPRLLFLERLARQAAQDARGGHRYPAHFLGELAVLGREGVTQVVASDIGPHGARLSLPAQGFLGARTPVCLRLACDASGASSFAPLGGHVAWARGERGGETIGVHLDLASKEDRLHWARVFHRCRADFEQRFIAVDRLVG
jgi:hypothetical protein